MLAASPSPFLAPSPSPKAFSPRRQHTEYDVPSTRLGPSKSPSNFSQPLGRSDPSNNTLQRGPSRKLVGKNTQSQSTQTTRPAMTDASTQYSPPNGRSAVKTSTVTPTAKVAGLQLSDPPTAETISKPPVLLSEPVHQQATVGQMAENPSTITGKRQVAELVDESTPQNREQSPRVGVQRDASIKRKKADAPDTRLMPMRYELCDTRDLVVLISSMLMELIRYNDAIPLRDGHLTRFHSRAPPGISVQDYLQRLTTHATLSPPILLSMVFYIDRLCALYSAFTISSLTVHRFLITSATVASKGLSDSFWTNKTYARVGGVSMKELALLELEFLARMDWRIVPKAEVLNEYYYSLVKRTDGFALLGDDSTEESSSNSSGNSSGDLKIEET